MKSPPTPDQAAAHRFLTELRTRISTQPLPYQHGVEPAALKSLWEVFVHARDAIKENPGCEKFAARATEVLNLVVRPLTAKWDRALQEGRLQGRDGADEFRGELRNVQEKLRAFAAELHEMAYGTPHADASTPDEMNTADLEALFKPLAFGFTAHTAALHGVADGIRQDEADAVTARRDAVFPGERNPTKPGAGHDAIGLALSGGGIRSATFSLGVVQVLADKGFLKEVDFLSTVSGGGYTGCFLTQRLGANEPLSDVAGPRGPDPEPVRYIRQHARFLSAGNLKEKWSMVTATLAGMVLNWTAPLFVILVLALIASQIGESLPHFGWIGFCFAAVLSVIGLVAYGWGMRQSKNSGMIIGRGLGFLLAATALMAAVWLLDPYFTRLVQQTRAHWRTGGNWGGLTALVALGTAAAPGIIRFLPVLKNPTVRKIVLKVALWIAGLLVPLVALVLFYTFREIAHLHFCGSLPAWITSHLPKENICFGVVILISAAVACALISLFVLNINLTGPHRLYRDGLARTFIQKTVDGTPDVKLTEMNAGGTAPYHLINATLNVPSSADSALKDRGCDFFLFSKNWMGSTATGYHPTGDWKTNGTDVDLATAMAVSGAAFSSYMGLGSQPALTALLTFLNVRLGFWIKKPAPGGFSAPGFTCLLREMTGFGMSEKARWLNLSDGGHIENLAVYELLRRRCKFIVCVDGEADPAFTFQGLMTMIRHAQIDFGIRVTPTLDQIRPDPKTGQSQCHFHLCRIHYPEGIGLLLYLKLSVTGNESELIKRYRISKPDFPHQTTLDQFFDQEQFEAYRQLGVHAAEGLFLPALMDGQAPASVPHWFRQLAKNLLEPIKT